jgi:hypothetical protein
VQPLLDLPEHFPDRWHHLRAVDEAISATEQFVASVLLDLGKSKDRATSIASVAVDAADSAEATATATAEAAELAAGRASNAAGPYADAVAARADAAARTADVARSAVAAARSAEVGVSAAVSAAMFSAKAEHAAANAARTDYVRLCRHISSNLTKTDFSQSDTLGPLWPGSPPNWYPTAKERMDHLLEIAPIALPKRSFLSPTSTTTSTSDAATPPLSLYFDLDDFTPEEIEEQIAALSDLYHAISDDELQIVGHTFLSPSLVPVED